MKTITAKFPANSRFRKRSRILVALGTVAYLIALYSLLTSFYIFEMRRSNTQIEMDQPKSLSVDKTNAGLKEHGFEVGILQMG